jgi:hypothetical protein
VNSAVFLSISILQTTSTTVAAGVTEGTGNATDVAVIGAVVATAGFTCSEAPQISFPVIYVFSAQPAAETTAATARSSAMTFKTFFINNTTKFSSVYTQFIQKCEIYTPLYIEFGTFGF